MQFYIDQQELYEFMLTYFLQEQKETPANCTKAMYACQISGKAPDDIDPYESLVDDDLYDRKLHHKIQPKDLLFCVYIYRKNYCFSYWPTTSRGLCYYKTKSFEEAKEYFHYLEKQGVTFVHSHIKNLFE